MVSGEEPSRQRKELVLGPKLEDARCTVIITRIPVWLPQGEPRKG